MTRIHISDLFRLPTALTVLALLAAAATAQPGPEEAATAGIGGWKLEEVRTADGHTYRGLLDKREDGEWEFTEVVRPRGKPMYLVVRPLKADTVAVVHGLTDDERQLLRRRVDAFRYRSRIEAGRMEDVELARSDEQGRTALHYDGSWFTLDSTADEESTRRCVVRVEQIFRAYRQLLPPRSQPQAPLRVMIFGSQDEYNDYLQTIGASIANGAFYSQQANVIAAASELNRFADRLKLARSRHEELRKTYQRLDDGLPKQLAELGAQLRGQGFAERDVDNELNARRLAWRNEMTAALVQLTAADRRNEGRFVDVTQEMFERMYHEGFHAYLENYVFPHERYSVPIWLNEGLAQVFQSGRLEADMLRIDAPPADSLRLLQAELAGDEPMSLTDLLAAPQREFQEQSVQPQRAARLYAAAWGVAHYLTFHQPLLGSAALDEYVATDAEQLAPPARFERLVGVPLEKFEQQWRTTMADLHAPR